MSKIFDLRYNHFATLSQENSNDDDNNNNGEIVSSENTSICKYCWNYIYWVKQSNGKWKAFNLDYTQHNCPEFEIARATGQTAKRLREYYRE
jgi:hypothetical protein